MIQNYNHIKAKNVSIELFSHINEFNCWKEKYPLYQIFDIQIRDKGLIYVIYQIINNND